MLFGKGLGFWNTMPMRRRSVTGSVSGAVRSSPSKRISPSIRAPGMRSFIRLKQRRSVLLPQPDGPIRAVIRWRGISMLISFSACDDPYQTDSERAVRTGSEAVSTTVGGVSGRLSVLGSGISGVSVPDEDGPGIHRQ